MSNKYRAIIFDLDNTLVDNDISVEHAIFSLYKEMKIPCTEENFRQWKEFNEKYWYQWESGKIIAPEWISAHLKNKIEYLRVKRFVIFFHVSYDDAVKLNEIYTSNFLSKIVPIIGVNDVLETLHNNFEIVITTNDTNEIAIKKIRNLNISPYVNILIANKDFKFSKPMPSFFDYTIDNMKTKTKDEILIVSRALISDILGGLNSNIDTCWFNPQHRINCLDIKPKYEIDSLKKLVKIL